MQASRATSFILKASYIRASKLHLLVLQFPTSHHLLARTLLLSPSLSTLPPIQRNQYCHEENHGLFGMLYGYSSPKIFNLPQCFGTYTYEIIVFMLKIS
jgi:hypothetical protein